MRIFFNLIKIMVVLAIAGGLAWKFYQPQIRGYLGIPEYAETEEPEEEVNEEEERDSSKSNSKLAETQKDSPVAEDPSEQLPPVEPLDKSQDEIVLELVKKRYPDVEATPFSDQFTSAADLPLESFPERIEIKRPINFILKENDRMLAASYVKAGGLVRPRRLLDGEKIEVSSLARGDMTYVIERAQTNFLDQAKTNFAAAHERAANRIQKYREEDAEELRQNSYLFRKVSKKENTWDDPENVDFKDLRASLAERVSAEEFKLIGVHSNGRVEIYDERFSGTFYVALVLLEGSDVGFGPFLWRAKCLTQSGKIVGWIGLPNQ